jgi:hypothetical protein
MSIRSRAVAALAASIASLLGASQAQAQAWRYPSFQQPRVVSRELNFAVADGGDLAGTSVLAQWREGMGTRSQLSLDVGVADGEYADSYFLIGGQFGHQLLSADRDMPIDLMLTAGANVAIGDPFSLVRIPVGVSVGHQFPLESGMAITPFAHPRLTYDRCGDCGVDGAESDIGVDFDLGVDFRFTQQLSMRLSGTFGGSEFFDEYDALGRSHSGSALGLALAWTPRRHAAAPAPARPKRTR